MKPLIDQYVHAIHTYVATYVDIPNVVYMEPQIRNQLYHDVMDILTHCWGSIEDFYGCKIYTDQTMVVPGKFVVTKLDNHHLEFRDHPYPYAITKYPILIIPLAKDTA